MTISKEQVTELLSRARRSSWPSELLVTGAGHQRWFGHLVTRIGILVGDEPVEYCDSHFEKSGEAFTAELALFTATRVVRARLAEGQAQAWAFGRSELERVVAGESGDFFDHKLGWPPPASIDAVYPRETLHLETAGLTEIELDRFHEFLPSLLADLGIGRARRSRVGQEPHHRAGWAW
jgi:hypothetical protein